MTKNLGLIKKKLLINAIKRKVSSTKQVHSYKNAMKTKKILQKKVEKEIMELKVKCNHTFLIDYEEETDRRYCK